MRKGFVLSCILFVFITGCNPLELEVNRKSQQEAIVEVSKVTTNQPVVIAQNLNIPWSIDRVNDTFYISERMGTITKIQGGQIVRQQVELKKKLSEAAEAGLMGFVLSPDFNESKRAYAYYTYDENSGRFNRIVSLILENDLWKEETLLLDKIPSGNFHHGGRIKIGPDQKLYATAGDALNSPLAQDLGTLAGKILRLNLDGTIPSDNPFQKSYIYSYGHRNPQGLTWSSDGTMYASEHGNSANDEINKIEPGKNYGWPVIEGMQRREGMVTPIFTSGSNNTWAPSGMAFYNGYLYVAALKGEAIFEFNLETGEQRKLVSGLGRIRDVFIEGDTLYFVTNNTDGRGNPQLNDDKFYSISLID
ncbi:MAG TPA: PQQ-dependent sugar dehydrogenase [Ureibacillus sp.]|nr:PQQ-dependent sugar dehydrogenase [Ureibacillus sp.]